MSAQPESIFSTLEAALSGAAPAHLNLAAMPAAAPIESPEERRERWLKQRWGKFSASQFHRLMTEPKTGSGLSKGAQTYAAEKACELLTECQPDSYTSPAMQWGIDHEPDAVEAFMARTGMAVTAHGSAQEFLLLGEDVGGTPDGLIADYAGLEIKCPASKTHLEYLGISGAESLKAVAPEYYWQCQGLMWITGREKWFFVSYDPRYISERLRLHIALIFPAPDDIVRLAYKIKLAREYRDSLLERVAA